MMKMPLETFSVCRKLLVKTQIRISYDVAETSVILSISARVLCSPGGRGGSDILSAQTESCYFISECSTGKKKTLCCVVLVCILLSVSIRSLS